MPDFKKKLVKALGEKLSPEQGRLLQLISFENRKEKLVARMPVGIFSLDYIWEVVVKECEILEIPLQRADTFATLAELDDILTDVEWLWKNRIPKGFVTMFVGVPGIGKSYMVLDLARVLTAKGKWPMTEENAPQSPVVWIDTEMKQQLLNMRSKFLGIDRSKMYIPAIDANLLAKFDAGLDNHRKHVVELVSTKKPLMLVVDSLGHAHSRGENKVEEVRPVMDFFGSVARDFNIAVLIIHHLNKGAPGEQAEISLARVRGSTDIAATPVVIYSIEQAGENSTKVRMIKNNLGAPMADMAIIPVYDDPDSEDKQIIKLEYKAYTAPPPKKTKKQSCAEWVVKVLKEENNPEGVALKTLEELGVASGFTRGNIYSARDILGDRITHTGTGRSAFWHLSDMDDTESINSIINGGKQ